MSVKTVFILTSFMVQFRHEHGLKHESKRLLIDDPNVISQRLLALEKLVQSLQVENGGLKNTVESLKTTVQGLQTTNQNLQTTVQSLQTNNQSLQATVRGIQTTNQNLQTTVQSLQTAVQSQLNSYGTMYIRWGKSGCGTNDTELIYSGFTAGQIARTGGGVATTICLPRDPTWGKQVPDAGVEIGGSEYETNFGQNAFNQDIPCAACRTRGRSSTIMIPGRFSCYSGFTMEYRGYLAGGSYDDPSDYICIDENPEFMMGGEANDDRGRRYYTAKVYCGPLPCPPYHDGKTVACVVCSK